MSVVENRLAAIGLTLPQPNPPVANYVPFVRVGNLVHISGQVSTDASGGIKGVVGVEIDPDDGDLDRLVRVIKLGGYVQAGPEFFEIPRVLNGCSDLMVEVFGEAGRHARSAVGVYRLPLNFAVEVDAVVEIK